MRKLIAVALLVFSTAAQAQTLYDMQRDQEEQLERMQDQQLQQIERLQDQQQMQQMQMQVPTPGSLFVPNNRGGSSIIGGGLFGG